MAPKKLFVTLAIGLMIIAGIAATRPPLADEHPHKNLKILPKNISHEDLDKIMDGFKVALGVKCNFCHAPDKDSSSHHLDFASDAKPEKNIARGMMKMTTKINKKYFSFNKDSLGKVEPVVECVTCHHGNAHPGEKHANSPM
jgi:Photosynthetic reaction centre cytochrome C subunit